MEVNPYVIRRGDTLGAIANFFGITLAELLDENPQIVNPNLIRVGETIMIPKEEREDSIHAHLAGENINLDLPPWFRVAMREEGESEIPGAGNNPRIIEYHQSTTLDRARARLDSTAWCSSFANWCMEQVGINGTDSAWAKTWDDWQSRLEHPRSGCVVVFSRTTETQDGGHVGFFIEDHGSTIEILGGNQGDKVSRARFPKNGIKGRFHYELLSYRWPEQV